MIKKRKTAYSGRSPCRFFFLSVSTFRLIRASAGYLCCRGFMAYGTKWARSVDEGWSEIPMATCAYLLGRHPYWRNLHALANSLRTLQRDRGTVLQSLFPCGASCCNHAASKLKNHTRKQRGRWHFLQHNRKTKTKTKSRTKTKTPEFGAHGNKKCR